MASGALDLTHRARMAQLAAADPMAVTAATVDSPEEKVNPVPVSVATVVMAALPVPVATAAKAARRKALRVLFIGIVQWMWVDFLGSRNPASAEPAGHGAPEGGAGIDRCITCRDQKR